MSLDFFNTSLTKKDPPWLISKSLKALEIKPSKIFNASFASSRLLSSFFSFVIIIDLYFLFPGSITKKFNSTAELAISISAPTKNTKSKIDTL